MQPINRIYRDESIISKHKMTNSQSYIDENHKEINIEIISP